ncbi:DUF1906 domain-containing protein [Kitasatospora sp. NPDC091207]|uniref:DUF1906 domain-containing protein n=1 Tax=Kitasatospora sp. NPDC091207 TaxID=3364083 RepID=UPI00381F61F4
MHSGARRRILTALGATALLSVGSLGSAQATPGPSPVPTKIVSYLGHAFTVPADWPVIDLTADPTACVRFDQHAVYLGTPGSRQDCPAHLVGRTEALVVQPGTDGAPSATTVSEIEREVRATAPGVTATGVYGDDQALVRTILASAGFPADAAKKPGSARTTKPSSPIAGAPAAGAPAAESAAAAPAAAPAPLPADATRYTGKGFDACTAPDSAAMSTWRANSPYQAVGIYIGGAARACSQPNLTSSWVQQQYNAGWRFMPVYVGVQASKITSPATQGTAAADDAVAQATALGLGRGNVLYYDMESYTVATYSVAVQQFLHAWTTELHALGYNSGVYSSASTGIADVVAAGASGKGYAMPDALFTARWNGAADTNDPVIPSAAWAGRQRVHQYDGNATETWGGVKIDIDRDYLDVQITTTPNGRPTQPGIYRPSNQTYALADGVGNLVSAVPFGSANDVPLTGHWSGPGRDTIGIYRPSAATFYLTNDNATVALAVPFGDVGDIPLVGDWTGQGRDTIGIYRPSAATFYLTNDNATVALAVQLGDVGDIPMVGNWSGTGKDTVGIYRPSTHGFYLSNSNTSVAIDHAVPFGNTGDIPVKGDWNGSGTEKVGVYRPSAATFYGAFQDAGAPLYSLRFGEATDTPLTGRW